MDRMVPALGNFARSHDMQTGLISAVANLRDVVYCVQPSYDQSRDTASRTTESLNVIETS